MSLSFLLSPGSVSHIAVAGVGLWIAMANSSTIALYHTESFIHLQVESPLQYLFIIQSLLYINM